MLAVTDLILDRLDESRDAITSSEVSLAALGLARLGVQPTVSRHSFLEALPRTMTLMDDQQVSGTVWSLGKMGAAWDALPIRLQKAIGGAIVKTMPKMAPLGVANTIHGTKV
jgi:hypothetical protein